ncbi:uncharacterized protein LOC114458255 [Gouania willdenowi]|nr:uncharacterized protein LOC114458255 [Gouania willdenowi]
MVEMIKDQLFLMDSDEASVSLDKEIKLSIESAEQERASDSYTLLKPLFSPSEIKSYMGYVTAVTSPFDFNIVIEDSSLAFKKLPIMVDDGLEGKRLSKDTLEFKSNNFPNHEDSSCNKPLSKKTNLLTVYPCLIRGVKPVGETNEWSDETIGFFRQHLYWKRLQIFLKEFLWGKHWGVDVLVDGSHVAKKLVDAGHAEYTDVLLELRFLEPLEDPHLESNTDEDRYENKKVSDQQQ